MPVITAIKPQKNNKRVNIYLDGKFGFGLDLENFVKLGLKVEQQLTGEEIEKITQKGEFQKISDRLLVFATLRPRSEKEINDWFTRKKVDAPFQASLIKKLYKLQLLDDSKFAVWWVQQRLQFKSRSKRQLQAELSLKGIDRNIVVQVLEEADIDEAKAAKRLLEKRDYKWRNFDLAVAKRKKTEFLARKGFSWDIIKKALE